MINVAILTGGPSAERGIAMKSAALVESHLDTEKYRHWTILVEEDGWFEKTTGQAVDLNTFSITAGDDRIAFDFAFLIIHGTPAEDGKLQGYFESRKIPHSTCDTLTCALTFNKQWCKDFLMSHNVAMADSCVVHGSEIATVDPGTFGYPVFVKPNNNGSSYGVSRVNSGSELHEALYKAIAFDDEVMIEAYLDGREFSCGVVKEGKIIHVFPITEIIPDSAFFDYAAKYEGAGQEITPAELDSTLTTQCQDLSRRLYRLLNCRGMVRFDYILVGETFNLLEVNTIPGLSEASIIPQQAQAYGWSITRLLDVVVEDAMNTIPVF